MGTRHTVRFEASFCAPQPQPWSGVEVVWIDELRLKNSVLQFPRIRKCRARGYPEHKWPNSRIDFYSSFTPLQPYLSLAAQLTLPRTSSAERDEGNSGVCPRR